MSLFRPDSNASRVIQIHQYNSMQIIDSRSQSFYNIYKGFVIFIQLTMLPR